MRIDAVDEIKKLQITSGIFTGAYQIAPFGRLNWYFVNLGLVAIVPYLTVGDLDRYVRSYMDLYLNNLEANASIKDVVFTNGNASGGYETILSDSDDSYAATFLSLATLYTKTSKNWMWWNNNKNTLKEIAYNNLAVPAKPTGLTSVFQSPRSLSNKTGYLMDNAESYRGLRDFADMLRLTGDSDANYYDSFASAIAGGISNILFDSVNKGFISNDTENMANGIFYPGTTCQVFPQAYSLTELASRFDSGWNYLNSKSPGWEYNRNTNNAIYDPFPWAILGFVAAKRGSIRQAKNQMKTIENLFYDKREFVTINELGFYQRTKAYLGI